MIIKLNNKFTDKELDEFIDKVYSNFIHFPNDKYHFDLTEVEFIGNQELLVLSALFKSFIESGIEFRVSFFKEGITTAGINSRIKRQIIQFWDVWKIWRIVPKGSYYDYFGIDGNSVQRLQEELNYYPRLSELYDRHGVTPFVNLNFINNYNEIDVQNLINPIYKLNSVIEDLLKRNNCYHPFTSNSLSTIITEELYLNFLDHSLESSFPKFEQMAFMSISFQGKLEFKTGNSGKREVLTEDEIQRQKAWIFETESLPETKSFFYDSGKRKYKNEPYIQFSFLDFGKGIASTLKSQFQKEGKKSSDKNLDSDILQYAFNHNSSRHPIFHEKNKLEQFIPRGLFDALTIIRRYKGLLVVRSNFGRIIFDFSNESEINKAFSYFGNEKLFFPGTLISLYLPAIEDTTKLNVSSIKPEITFAKVKPDNKKYVSINSIVENLKVGKEELYSKLLQELKNSICKYHDHSLVFVSFKGCEIDKRLIKKTIYFLLTDYDINHRNNVVILNSPAENIITEIASEILELNDALKNYKLHPLPIIGFDENNEDLNIKWLGVYDKKDKEILNNLIYDQYSIAKSDFRDPANISGHLNEFDSYGNLISNFPSRDDIINFYRIENDILISKQVEKLLEKYECIKKDDNDSLYLCNGNYYQKEYVELNNLVNDKSDCSTITQLLFSKLKFRIKNLKDYKFIGITTTSHKLLKSLELQNLITKDDYISLDNYHTFENDLNEEMIDSTTKYILICDVISTGFLTQRLNKRLLHLETSIEYIAVVTSTLHPNFKTSESFLKDYEGRILTLHEYPIVKLMRKELGNELFSKNIIRVNPHTNIPIRLSINETNFNESIIFHTSIDYSEHTNEITIQNKFLDSVSEDAIHVGFYKFNNVIHPYFFNTEIILSEFSEELLKEVFKKINNSAFAKEKIQVFYPRKSGIDFFKFAQLKSVLKNQLIEEIEIERFGTPEGWRFPHNTDYLSAKIENNFCLILDDGSCSGDSLIQMIDEISFYDAKEIVLLCIIGRINDHKREFFSRLSNIKVKNAKTISISIYFVCHWHIPTYYLDENPNIKETVWLQDILNLQNTPQSIKKIANSIVEQIRPKNDKAFKDYKYLPKDKKTKEIPKKELLIIREELGKVIGYRLYKESFNFFDCFIKKYQKKGTGKDHFKEIELLCATFIYEPYLYDKISGALPDVTERIESFVENLIFSTEKIYDNLTFHWNKKDIVHLFFIVFKNEKLVTELKKPERFKQLIDFTQKVDSTTNYVLYKLLKYFPLNTSQFAEKKFDNQIKDLIINLKDDETIPNKEIKKYYNFIASLPSRSDFNSQLSQLKENYVKQKEPEFHDEKKSFNHNVSELIVTIREIIADVKSNKTLQTSNVNTVRKCWFKISNFINPILSFSSSFKEFLLPYTFYELANQVTSLREMVGFIEDVILSNNEFLIDLEKLETIKKYVTKIQLDFELNSTFHQVIENHQSSVVELISNLKKEISSSFKIAESEAISSFTKSILNIPKNYLDKLLIAELTTNMKKYSKNGSTQIKLNYKIIGQDKFELQITNEILNLNSKNSNGEGTKCLRLLSDSDIFGFKYSSKTAGKEYIQTLTFNLI